MTIKINAVMNKSDWIKLSILIIISIVAITLLLVEYQKTSNEYSKILTSATFTEEKNE